MCNASSGLTIGSLSTGAVGDETPGEEANSGAAGGAECTAKYRASETLGDAVSAPRLIRTLTSPRSNSNSAMSFSIKNSISSFNSF